MSKPDLYIAGEKGKYYIMERIFCTYDRPDYNHIVSLTNRQAYELWKCGVLPVWFSTKIDKPEDVVVNDIKDYETSG